MDQRPSRFQANSKVLLSTFKRINAWTVSTRADRSPGTTLQGFVNYLLFRLAIVAFRHHGLYKMAEVIENSDTIIFSPRV